MKALNLPEKYRAFFSSAVADGVRHVLCQGGRRSRKTWSTYEWIYAMGAYVGGLTILVATYQFPTLQLTIQDFEQCIGVPVCGSLAHGYHAVTSGDTLWRFNHYDTRSKAQGTQCDILFINEAVQVPESVAKTLLMGTRRQAYYNYNPTDACWLSDVDNARLLKTTFRDNPYLTDQQLAEFEAIRERAQRKTASRWDLYQYRVFYLGEFDKFVGKVFPSLGRCSLTEYQQIPAAESYGLDFGFATDGDPTTLVGCKIHGNKIYFHEYIYERGLTSDIELGQKMIACGLNYRTYISADYGGMGKGRIYNLRTADNGKWSGDLAKGFNVCDAMKTTVMDGISQLLTADEIVITEPSERMRAEFEGYTIDEGGKPKGDDHAIDAGRYAYVYNKRNLC